MPRADYGIDKSAATPPPFKIRTNAMMKHHPGPTLRAKRMAAALTLSEASYKAEIDISTLSKFERAIADLPAEAQTRIEDVVTSALRSRSQQIERVMSVGA
jgi:hypothetical protein